MIFRWGERNRSAVRVSLIGGNVMLSSPEGMGLPDCSFNDQIPVPVWHRINEWVVRELTDTGGEKDSNKEKR